MITSKKEIDHLAGIILDSCMAVHKELGPGLLESVYEMCLCQELIDRGLEIDNQVVLPIYYKGKDLKRNFIIDILVENEILIEIKAVENLLPVHQAQIISYLKIADKYLGLLINFNVPVLKDGFRRYLNGYRS